MKHKKLKIGISSCLLGKNVRYNGENKLDRFIVKILGHYFSYIPICPEVECGLGIPRLPMRLEGNPKRPKLVITSTNIDITKKMLSWSKEKVHKLEKEHLDGFIFKSRSPSCGILDLTVYRKKKSPPKKGQGLFVKMFKDHFPLIPIEEGERLHDPELLKSFFARILIYKYLRNFLTKKDSLIKILRI